MGLQFTIFVFFALYAYHFKALIPTVLLSLGQTVKLSGLALGTEQLRLRLLAVWVALSFAVWVVALQTELLASKVTVERNSKPPPPLNHQRVTSRNQGDKESLALAVSSAVTTEDRARRSLGLTRPKAVAELHQASTSDLLDLLDLPYPYLL